jgi:hypothetical protein
MNLKPNLQTILPRSILLTHLFYSGYSRMVTDFMVCKYLSIEIKLLTQVLNPLISILN